MDDRNDNLPKPTARALGMGTADSTHTSSGELPSPRARNIAKFDAPKGTLGRACADLKRQHDKG